MTSTTTQSRQMIWGFVGHEHEELIAGIDRIHDLAGDLSGLSADRRSSAIAKVLCWVDETLKPHMAWEESWLFPQIDDRAHSRWVTRLLRFDHLQIAHQSERLRTYRWHVGHGQSRETVVQVSGDLIGLETLLRANLELEDHFLMPLFDLEADRWTPEWRD